MIQFSYQKGGKILNERLKELRKSLNMTLKEFGKRLGVTDAAISRLEKGERNLTEQMILSICREFEINENWLRNGIEPMKKTIEDEATKYVNNLLTDDNPFYDLIKGIMKTYDKLDCKSQEVLQHFSEELLKELHTSANEKLSNTNPVTTEAATSETYSVREAEEEYIKSRLNSAKSTDSFATSITTDISKKAINE